MDRRGGERLTLNLLPPRERSKPEPTRPTRGDSPEDLELATSIATRLCGLAEPAMRGAALAEILVEMEICLAASVIGVIVRQGRRGGPPFELALGGLEEMLRSERLEYELLSALYRELKTGHLGEAATLLLPGHCHRTILGAPGPRLPGGRELTLGERKSLARAAPRETIDHLLRDPEPMVIRLLLRNPRLVERDVVGLAARRPAQPEVIREIMASSRWLARYPVKHAIVLNPGVPNELALRLLPFMTRKHLSEISRDPALPTVRRQAARRLL